MRMHATLAILAMPAFLAAGQPLEAQSTPVASVELIDVSGTGVGEAQLRQTPRSGVLLTIEVTGLSPGAHALHVHETGRCDTPSFDSAGGHYAPAGRAHGALHPDGKHAGDLMNLQVAEDGTVRADRLLRDVTLRPGLANTLLDRDGSALVIHGGSDDYDSQPSGDAGDRVVCGVIRDR